MDFLANLLGQRIVAACLSAVLAMGVAYPVASFFTRRPDSRKPTDPPAIKVMVLGLEGSGKTMMLAGMYYRWAFGGRQDVVLRADAGTVGFLAGITNVVNDPHGRLSPTTLEGDVTNATFGFMVRIAGAAPRQSFSLHYIDYAGERIRPLLFPDKGQVDPEVRGDFDTADILVGVLDGGQIAQAMRGDPPPDFAQMIAGLMLCLANADQKTIHLVISKWDLVVDANGTRHPFPKVIKFLNTYQPFRGFHQQAATLGVRRIIPVSAIDLNGFIRIDKDGTVHKNSAVPWKPFMTEKVVACSVPDVIDTEFRRDIQMCMDVERDGAHRPRDSLAPLVTTALWLCDSVATVVVGSRIFGTQAITSGELSATFQIFKSMTGEKSRSVGDGKSSEPEALLQVLQLFEESVHELEREFPASRIDGYPPRGNRNGSAGPVR